MKIVEESRIVRRTNCSIKYFDEYYYNSNPEKINPINAHTILHETPFFALLHLIFHDLF